MIYLSFMIRDNWAVMKGYLAFLFVKFVELCLASIALAWVKLFMPDANKNY